MRRLSFALAVAANLLALPAAAQDARVAVATGDGGRYVKLLDPKTKVAGYGPAAAQAFRSAMGPLIAQLDGMAEVNTPPPGICHQLNSWIELSGALDARVLAGAVEVMRPLDYRDGRCIRTNNALVMIGLNRTSDLIDRREAVQRDAESREGRNWYMFAAERAEPGRIDMVRKGYRVVALTRSGAPLFVPVSAERYAAEQLRVAEAFAAADPRPSPQLDYWRRILPQARASGLPACITLSGLLETLDLSGACRSRGAIMEMNPAYFDTARPGDLQLLTVVTPVRGDNASEPSRRAIWDALDFGRLAALVR